MLDPTKNSFLPTAVITPIVTSMCHAARQHDHVSMVKSSIKGTRLDRMTGEDEARDVVVFAPQKELGAQSWMYGQSLGMLRELKKAGPTAPYLVPIAFQGMIDMMREDYEAGRCAHGELALAWKHKGGESHARLARACGLDADRPHHLEWVRLAVRLLLDALVVPQSKHKGNKEVHGLFERVGEIQVKPGEAPEGCRSGTWIAYRLHEDLLKMIPLNRNRKLHGKARFTAVPASSIDAGPRAACLAQLLYRARAVRTPGRHKQRDELVFGLDKLGAQLGVCALARPEEALGGELDRLVAVGAIERWEWTALKKGGRGVRVRYIDQSARAPIESSDRVTRANRALRSRRHSGSSPPIASGPPPLSSHTCACAACAHPSVDPCRSTEGVEPPPRLGGADPG